MTFDASTQEVKPSFWPKFVNGCYTRMYIWIGIYKAYGSLLRNAMSQICYWKYFITHKEKNITNAHFKILLSIDM